MQADPYVRVILTFIALCLLVLVARGLGVGEPEAPPAAESGLWQLQLVRTGLGGPPTLLRMNTSTGEVWHLRFGGNQAWSLVGAAEDEAEEPPAASAPPAPAAPPAGTPPQPPPAPQAVPQP
jgi:hypothetical protein